jgi:hypothetical protein
MGKKLKFLLSSLIAAGIDRHFRKLSHQHADSIAEDIPFVLDVSNLLTI